MYKHPEAIDRWTVSWLNVLSMHIFPFPVCVLRNPENIGICTSHDTHEKKNWTKCMPCELSKLSNYIRSAALHIRRWNRRSPVRKLCTLFALRSLVNNIHPSKTISLIIKYMSRKLDNYLINLTNMERSKFNLFEKLNFRYFRRLENFNRITVYLQLQLKFSIVLQSIYSFN